MTKIKLWLSYLMLAVSILALVLFAAGEAYRLAVVYYILLSFMIVLSLFHIIRNLPNNTNSQK